MKSYLVDTSVIIDFLRGKEEAVELLRNIDGDISSSYICLAELYEGVYRSNNPEHQEKIINNFFKNLASILSIDEDIAKQFGEMRTDLKKKGMIIEDLDLLLAATCLSYNLTLVTFNKKHFAHIDNLQIY